MESISFARADGKAVPALVCGPVGAPAVVVIQEWWGVDFEIKEHAQRIAAMGYRALVPDLYRGKLGSEAEEAHHLMGALDFPDAVLDIIGCARHLRAEGSPRVGVTGFCMGGALTIGAAVRGADVLDCAAPFYGYNGQLADVAECKVPMQGHFGALDTSKGFRRVRRSRRAAPNQRPALTRYPPKPRTNIASQRPGRLGRARRQARGRDGQGRQAARGGGLQLPDGWPRIPQRHEGRR